MHANQQTLKTFYSAFARLDADAMAGCYADDAAFEDGVFSLRGKPEIAGLWRMLCETTRAKGEDVRKLQYRDLQADAATGRIVRHRRPLRFLALVAPGAGYAGRAAGAPDAAPKGAGARGSQSAQVPGAQFRMSRLDRCAAH